MSNFKDGWYVSEDRAELLTTPTITIDYTGNRSDAHKFLDDEINKIEVSENEKKAKELLSEIMMEVVSNNGYIRFTKCGNGNVRCRFYNSNGVCHGGRSANTNFWVSRAESAYLSCFHVLPERLRSAV